MRQMRQISTRLVVISLVSKYFIISNVYYTVYINCSSLNYKLFFINTPAAYLFRLTKPMLDRIQESIHTNSTVTMERLTAVIHDEFQVKVCSSTIDRAMKKLQYSFNRRATHIKAVVATDVLVSEVVAV